MEIASHGPPHYARSLTAPLNPPGVVNHPNHGHYAAHPPPPPPPAQHQHRHTSSNMSATQNPLVHSQGHTASSYSIQSQPSSRSSDTTQGTSHSTLFPPPPMPSSTPSTISNASTLTPSNASTASTITNNHDVRPTDNIMNSVADASSSLFQICITLRQRLLAVPGFSECLLEVEEDAEDDTDPVTLLWRTFRRGYPLILLYNTLQPSQPLTMPQAVREDKKGKLATMQFVKACMSELKFPQEELFIITDLYGDDTTGFVKVARVVHRVLDILVQRGLIEDVRPTAADSEQAAKRTQRQHIVAELVKSERTYVQHLELLQAFKNLVEEKGVIPGDAVHDIFLNLNALLDFQRRFLIRVEQTNHLPEEKQNWGEVFLQYSKAFDVYEPYIANQKKCEKTVIADFPKLREAGGSIEMRQMVESPAALHSFLMKPFQRLTKYPLLLEQLHKKGDLDEQRKEDLLAGMEAATAVLNRTNEAVAKEEKVEAVQELKARVEDWKGHRIEGFGDLLLYGTFTVLKSENLASGKDGERQYHVYLFETILLCCKNIDLNKPKNKLSQKNLTDKMGKPKLQLKGRIFMQNVTDLVSLSKPGMNDYPLSIGSAQRIFWKGDPSIENFIIRFTTEDALKKWASQIEKQRKNYRERASMARESGPAGTSTNEFIYMQNQPALENPYAQDIEEEDEEDDVETVGSASGGWPGHPYPHSSGSYSQSRNGSSSSLRSRSTTGESAQSVSSRAQPPRMPPGMVPGPALTLRTRELQQQSASPGDSRMDSYFSPATDSPISSRTSTSSGMYPFPRQAYPSNGYYEEGQGTSRFTAPAMARPQNAPPNGYGPTARSPAPRPGFPPGSGMHSSQQMPGPRNRSASSPDIHNGQRVPMRNPSQPPVPEVPAGYQNRSQTSSPQLANGMPPMSMPGRGSPQMIRERQYSAQQDMSPTEYGYPNAPRLGMPQHPRAPSAPRVQTVQSMSMSPAPPVEQSPNTPAQLKVKVQCPLASQTLTLVVSTNIAYQTLKDRIDQKLQRSTNLTLGDRTISNGQERIHVKLKYLDEDDYVSIQSDEDVQTAFETWREQKGEGLAGLGEIELFCQR